MRNLTVTHGRDMAVLNRKQHEAIFRAIADPTRREILGLLRHRKHTVGQLAGNFRTSRPAISNHLGHAQVNDSERQPTLKNEHISKARGSAVHKERAVHRVSGSVHKRLCDY